jgi:hypothetical protein
MSTKQRLFLTAEMCLGMGSIMSLIGNLFAMGWTTSAFHAFFVWWVQTIVVAFIYNLMVASNITNWLISRATVGLTGQALLKKSSQIRGWTMIVIMCFSMCTWGLLTAGQLPAIGVTGLLMTWARSFILAYIVRGILVKPLAMRIMLKVVPA